MAQLASEDASRGLKGFQLVAKTHGLGRREDGNRRIVAGLPVLPQCGFGECFHGALFSRTTGGRRR